MTELDYKNGSNCVKLPWLYKNKPAEESEIDEDDINLFDESVISDNEIKAIDGMAAEFFKLNNILVKENVTFLDGDNKATARFVKENENSIDIYDLYYVARKNNDSDDEKEIKKKIHFEKLAYIVYLAQKAGKNVQSVNAVFVNKNYVKNGEIDCKDFFIIYDCTEKVFETVASVPAKIADITPRCMLSDVSDYLGGFTQEDLLKTVEYFDYKCPYTGEDITEIFVSKKWSLDHLIPHNRFNCGLNLYGNIIVTTPKTNGKKSSKDFKKFILEETQGSVEEKEARIAKIIQFQKDSGYTKVMENITELSDLCKKEYDLVEEKLSDLNKEYLSIINKENVIDIVEEDISDSTDDAKITVSTIIPSQPVSMPQNISGNIPDNYFVGKVGKQRAYDYLTSLGINIHTNMNIGKTNKANNKYWVNPEFTCLNSDWSLVLNDTVNKELHIFQIPAGSISSSDLVSRADNNKIDLQIRYADPCYEDTRSKYCFSQWYYKTIQY